MSPKIVLRTSIECYSRILVLYFILLNENCKYFLIFYNFSVILNKYLFQKVYHVSKSL